MTITSSTQTIPNNLNSSAVVCFQGNFTYSTNFNIDGSRVCIGAGVTLERNGGNWNNAWTINNHGTLKLQSLNYNSNNTINNFGSLKIPGNIIIGGTLNLAGTVEFGGTLHLNSTGRISALNANQCNSVIVNGAFTTDGVITGNHLDYGGTGSALFVNKAPGGNASPKLTGDAIVGSCSSIGCVETITTKESGRTDMVYIYRCSGIFTLPETIDEQKLSGFMLLLVAGGGGGGRGESAGGGGAGAVFQSNNIDIEPNIPYQVIVGSGGTGATTMEMQGNNGFPSSFFGIEARGGGGGGSSSATSNIRNGRNGGSGGGGAANSTLSGTGGTAQGSFATIGGLAFRNNSNVLAGGGGGGASSKGLDANPPEPGHGGNGMESSVLAGLNNFPLPNRFSAGGGGTGRNSSSNSQSPGLGGSVNEIRIGGNGINNISSLGGKGVTNTGSGGGAGGGGGGAGATGVVVLRLSFGALPVEYAYINCGFNELKRKVNLYWATSKEWENSHFEIERSINSVNNWEKVGEVEGIGWSDIVSEYVFEDSTLMARGGNYYYRLRQVDFNLEYEYSKTVLVRVPEVTSSDWRAYPNPIYDGDLINVFSKKPLSSDKKVYIRVISSLSTISAFSASTESEINEKLQASVNSLPKGLFLIEVTMDNKVEYIKIIKR